MQIRKRKIELMHELYGMSPMHRCGDCGNYSSGKYHDRILRKCARYGLTHSEASDWAKSWMACGMFDVPLPDSERPVIEYKTAPKRNSEPLDGQASLFEG